MAKLGLKSRTSDFQLNSFISKCLSQILGHMDRGETVAEFGDALGIW
jgi:hypothetical protein